jgi:hypothetical protein
MDLVDAVISRAKQRDVDTVVVAGEIQVRGGKHLRHDIESVSARIQHSMSSFTDKDHHELEQLADALLPYLRKIYSDW